MFVKQFSYRMRSSQARSMSKEETNMHRFGKRSWLLGLALVATIGATVIVATASAQSRATVTLTFWNEMNDQEYATAQTLVTQFEGSHPDIKINMTQIPFS